MSFSSIRKGSINSGEERCLSQSPCSLITVESLLRASASRHRSDIDSQLGRYFLIICRASMTSTSKGSTPFLSTVRHKSINLSRYSLWVFQVLLRSFGHHFSFRFSLYILHCNHVNLLSQLCDLAWSYGYVLYFIILDC